MLVLYWDSLLPVEILDADDKIYMMLSIFIILTETFVKKWFSTNQFAVSL